MDARELVVSPSVRATTADTASAADTAVVTTSAAVGSSSSNRHCQAISLPAGGILYIPGSDPVTLTAAAAYRPLCRLPSDAPAIVAGGVGHSTNISDVYIDEAAVAAEGAEATTTTSSAAAASTTPQYSDFRDPFYASTFPQCYALASTTVIAYTLVIMLFVTPRSFLDGGVVVLGRRGFTNGGAGGKNIGGRPWLQKVAALTVAVSLTIATADTFRVAESQYSWGIQNAKEMQDEVLGGTELKVIRIISDTFLWLAQAQTLIRLFPRQREKVIIKWTAFSLITLDVIFDCLNSFLYANSATASGGSTISSNNGRSFTDAVPALSYLFQLALGVLYAAWVIYYSFMKKRYAYYHPRMKNICLVAALSLLAILVPVVFFVLDICKPEFTGWGDYVLWVGAAAASVIVWEWVERIEALEREEKKDGILGREVFDGDEMLDVMPLSWPRRSRRQQQQQQQQQNAAKIGKVHSNVSSRADDSASESGGRGGGGGGGSTGGAVKTWLPTAFFTHHRHRLRLPWQTRQDDTEAAPGTALRDLGGVARGDVPGLGDGPRPAMPDASAPRDAAHAAHAAHAAQRPQPPPLWPSRPAPAATPVSRTETASADSTVYVMRYHPVSDSGATGSIGGGPTTAGPHQQALHTASLSRSNSTSTTTTTTTTSIASTARSSSSHGQPAAAAAAAALHTNDTAAAGAAAGPAAGRWHVLSQALPFRRSTAGTTGTAALGPPATALASPAAPSTAAASRVHHNDSGGRWDLRARLEEFAVMQAERLRERIRPTVDTTGLPVMVIPAPQRQGAMLARVLEEEENSQQEARPQPAAGTERPPQPQPVPPPAPLSRPAHDHGLWRSNSGASRGSSGSSRLSRSSGSRLSSLAGPPVEEPPAVVREAVAAAAALSRAGSDASSQHARRPA